MTKIYLACPYKHKDPAIRVKRFEEANKKAAELMQQGYAVFSPISHSHPISLYTRPENTQDFKFWLIQDLAFLRDCDELWVLQLDGWEESKGVEMEIITAASLGKPIHYITEDKDPYPRGFIF